jgi:hypothetical protein
MQFYTIMSHHFIQDKAVKKLGVSEIILLRLFTGEVFFKSLKAKFQLEYLVYNQYLENFSLVGDSELE